MASFSLSKKFPKFILVLVFTELWERFSYFSLKMILTLYMVNEMKLDDEYAYGIASLNNAFANYIPIITGYFADKYFGFINMLYVGGIIIVFGHFMMFLSIFNDVFFYWGVGAVATGTGFFRGNILNLLGSSYDTDLKLDRVSGFTLFYASVNLGAFSAALSSGYISTYLSYHVAFSLAGIGMIVGLIFFYLNRKLYTNKDVVRDANSLQKKIFMVLKPVHLLFIISFVLTIPLSGLLYVADFIAKYNLVFYVTIPFVLTIAYYFFKIKSTRERKNYCILIIYLIFLMIFFAYEIQLGSVFPIFVERNVYKYIGPVPVPAPVSQTINPGLIMIVGLITSTIASHNNKYDLHRMAFGMISNTFCFMILRLGTINADPETGLTSYIYPIVGVGIMATGEIMMTPLIQAATTQYSPKGMKGVMMGMYMGMMGFAGLTGFIFAEIFKVPMDENGNIDNLVSLEIYKDGFLLISLVNIIFFVIFLLCIPIILFLRRPTASEKQKVELNNFAETPEAVV